MARIGYSVVILFLLAINRAYSADGPDKLYLTIYYESKCSDSRHFIVEQLVRAVSQLQDYLILKLVPFGKADSDGHGGFTCQHGLTECMGNMVQDCTLDLMQDRSYTDIVDYVKCEMVSKAGSRNSSKCVRRAKVSTEEVNQCLASGKGTALQLDSEYLTKLINPKFIPTVTIDGIFGQQTQDSSQEDLLGTLCSFLQDVPACGGHHNDIAMGLVLT